MQGYVNDFVESGLDISGYVETVTLVKEFVDIVDSSEGGLLSPHINIYPENYAEAVCKVADVPTTDDDIDNKRVDRYAYLPFCKAYIFSNISLVAPQSGQVQLSGSCSNGVPGATP